MALVTRGMRPLTSASSDQGTPLLPRRLRGPAAVFGSISGIAPGPNGELFATAGLPAPQAIQLPSDATLLVVGQIRREVGVLDRGDAFRAARSIADRASGNDQERARIVQIA